MFRFERKNVTADSSGQAIPEAGVDENVPPPKGSPKEKTESQVGAGTVLPTHRVNHNGHKVTKGIHPDGESGRSWFHPWHFFRICFRSSSHVSMVVNVLWPFVPAAIAFRYTHADDSVMIFALSFIAMIPCANLIGFAGQEIARKMPRVFGILFETTMGSIVEIVLFMVLLSKDDPLHTNFAVIRAAILGSILSTMLLCLGLCFFAGGLRRDEQTFHESVSEVGNGLLLTAGFGLIIPSALHNSLTGKPNVNAADLAGDVLWVSRITSVLLIIAYAIYIYFNMRSHHGIYDDIFEEDERRDEDRHVDLVKDKLTLIECIIALTISIGLVSFLATLLVEEIPTIVHEHHISEAFMGLILVPMVEKFAEHLTAIDEAWDNTMNLALSHVLGSTIQTALFNAPLVVIVSWGLGKEMDLNFEIFTIVVVILSIIVMGNFLRDQKSNYLEGALSVIIWIIIAVAAYYTPEVVTDSAEVAPAESGTASGTASAVAAATETAVAAVHRMLMK